MTISEEQVKQLQAELCDLKEQRELDMKNVFLKTREACAVLAWSEGMKQHMRVHDVREVMSSCASEIRKLTFGEMSSQDEIKPSDAVAALRLYEIAFSDLFSQCCSNPVYNSFGKEVNMRLLNEAHLRATRVLNSEPDDTPDNMPALGVDEIYVAKMVQPEVLPYHLILIKNQSGPGTWQDLMDWAKSLNADLPTTFESLVVYTNLKALLKVEWYWTHQLGNQFLGYQHAWKINGRNGDQISDDIGQLNHGFAVRRVPA